jgi:hypothetical protein
LKTNHKATLLSPLIIRGTRSGQLWHWTLLAPRGERPPFRYVLSSNRGTE